MTRVETSEYEFSHGRTPRGKGQWAFSFDGIAGIFWTHGTYTEAKAEARREARRLGATKITVGS